jgi:hypothetical protein
MSTEGQPKVWLRKILGGILAGPGHKVWMSTEGQPKVWLKKNPGGNFGLARPKVLNGYRGSAKSLAEEKS